MNIIIIFTFLFFSIFSSILLIKSNNVYQGGDTQFHLKRIFELIESVKQGNIFPSFSFNAFHGSAVMSLYPYLNLLPVAFLSFVIKSKVLLMYSFFIFNTFLTFIIGYFSSKNYINSYSTSYIFAVIYSLSNIFLGYNLSIVDFGIVSTYTFFPLIIFSFLNVIHGKNSWLGLSVGMIMVSFSHILNVFIIGAFLIIFTLINIRDLNKYVLWKLFKAFVLFIIISSIIWLPFLYLYFYNLHAINMPFISQLNNIKIKDFMSGIYGSKINDTIGFFSIITVFISIFFYKKFNKDIKQMYLLSLIVILSVIFLPWHKITSYQTFEFLNIFQRLFRFLFIPQMLLSFIFALIISQYIKRSNLKFILYFLTILIAITLQLAGQYSFVKKPYVSINKYLQNNNNVIDNNLFSTMRYKFNNTNQFNLLINSYQDSNDDYIPKSALPMSSFVNHDLGFYNDYHKIKVSRVGYNTLNFSGNDNINKLTLPIYAYNKEKLHVYLNGRLINNYVNDYGLLTIDNIQNNIKTSNKIYIKSALDSFKIIGIILSIVGWLFVLVILIKRKFIN